MHKARCRANEYYWKKLKREQGVERKRKGQKNKLLYILMENDAIPYCNYTNESKENSKLEYEDFKAGIEYAKENFWMPVIVHNNNQLPSKYEAELKDIETMHIYPADASLEYDSSIIVYDNQVNQVAEANNSILLVNNKNITNIPEMVKQIFTESKRINLVLQESNSFEAVHLTRYEQALDKIVELIFEYSKNDVVKEINVLTDRLVLKEMGNCQAGVDNLSLAPDGNLYICPAFYYSEKLGTVLGSFTSGFEIKDQYLLERENAPICLECDAFQCKRCVYQNKLGTTEFNTPTAMQCKISHLEREKSYQLQQKLLQAGIETIYIQGEEVEQVQYEEPLELLVE